MSLVQDRPRQTSAPEAREIVKTPEQGLVEHPWSGQRQAKAPARSPAEAPWPDPQQGVIEEARQRQRRRRTRLAIAAIAAAVLIAVIGPVIEGKQAKAVRTSAAGRSLIATANAPHAPVFDVRLAPTLEVGWAGWQIFYEENGEQVGGTGTGPALSSDAYIADEASRRGSDPWTARLITTPNVAAILIGGRTRVPTVLVPGLPYAYRAARILTRINGAKSSAVPLDAEGQPILSRQVNRQPIQAKVTSWRYPGRTPEGSCGLRASPLPGLTAQAGRVATAIRPYSESSGGQQIVGHAFLLCVSVEYRLQGMPLRALILLDAAHPSGLAAALPDFKPVNGAPGFLDEGGLTAKREGDARLIVSQGASVAQRVELLRHLTALVKLDALVPASTGVAEHHLRDLFRHLR